ncbi:MAG: DNA-3-methyladenine glycosylase I [Actinomycetes bacterium]
MGDAGVVLGDDGIARCAWGDSSADYRAYHDDEWGRHVHGDEALYERITLEAFQSGLSWITILRKRPAFRAAFAGFDPVAVAAFDTRAQEELMADAGIVRNHRKIEATIANANAVVRLRERDGDGALDRLVWSFAPSRHRRPRRFGDIPSQTPESTALSNALKANGFVFVGPTTMYAAMQACGLVDDHMRGCHRASG